MAKVMATIIANGRTKSGCTADAVTSASRIYRSPSEALSVIVSRKF